MHQVLCALLTFVSLLYFKKVLERVISAAEYGTHSMGFFFFPLQLSLLQNTFIVSNGKVSLVCSPDRYHLYDTKNEVFLILTVSSRYQK
jgi:hypothetical protein